MNTEWVHITFREADVFYSVVGSGPSLMLVHGFGEDGQIFKNQVTALAGRFRLIIPDLPGSGRSSLLSDPAAGIEDLADCLLAILKNEKTEKCIMLGHSMGGYITLAMAEKYPEYLRGFGLIHSTAFADSEEKIQTRKKGMAFMKEHGAHEFLKTSIPGLFHDTVKNREELQVLLSRAGRFSTDSLCRYYEAMIKRPDRRHVITRAGIPFLLIAGSHDTAVPLSQSMQMAYLAENTEIHILRNSGHMGMLEEPEKFNRIIDSFLANPLLP